MVPFWCIFLLQSKFLFTIEKMWLRILCHLNCRLSYNCIFWKPFIVLNSFSLKDREELKSFDSYWHRFHFWNAPEPEQIIQFCVPNPCPHFLHAVHSHYPLIFILKWKMFWVSIYCNTQRIIISACLEIYFKLTIMLPLHISYRKNYPP